MTKLIDWSGSAPAPVVSHSRHEESDGVTLRHDLFDGDAMCGSFLLTDSGSDLSVLELDGGVVDGQLSDPGQVVDTLLVSVLSREPSLS